MVVHTNATLGSSCPGNVNLYGPGNVSVLPSQCYQLMCALVPIHDAQSASREFVSRMGIAARKSLRPALAVGLYGVGGVERGSTGVMDRCNARAGKSLCPIPRDLRGETMRGDLLGEWLRRPGSGGRGR